MVSFLDLVLGGIRVMLLIRAMGCLFESLEYPKIEYQIQSKARLSHSLYFFLLRGNFERRNVVTLGGGVILIIHDGVLS